MKASSAVSLAAWHSCCLLKAAAMQVDALTEPELFFGLQVTASASG